MMEDLFDNWTLNWSGHNKMAESYSDYTLAAEAIYKDEPGKLKSILDRAGPTLVNSVWRNRNKVTLLHLAVRRGRSNIVQMLLERGFDVNAQNNFNQTPFHRSLDRAGNEIFQLLLDNGADVNMCDCWGRTPLHLWRQGGDFLAPNYRLRILAKRGANLEARDFLRGYTPLHYATECGSQEAIEILLDRGANIESCTRHRNLTALHLAAKMNNVKLAKLLLDRGANIEALDDDQETPLHSASRFIKAEDGVRLLLQRGANVNARNKYNNTPLLLAILGGSDCIVKVILEHQPDINDERALSLSLDLLESETVSNLKDARASIHETLIAYGFTLHDFNRVDSLCVAIERGNYARARLLIEQGIRPDQVQDNREFLIRAIANKRGDVLELLVKSGLNVNVIDPCINPWWSRCLLGWREVVERSPLETTSELKFLSMLKTLLDNEADPPRDWFLSGIESWPINGCDDKFKIIEILLNRCADIDFPDADNRTTLDRALSKGNTNCVRMLLLNGADVNDGESTLGRLPYDMLSKIDLINKLHIAGSYVSDYNIYLLEQMEMQFSNVCNEFLILDEDEIYRAEVSRMKKHELLVGVSLHRIFITEDQGYLSNRSLMDKLELVNFDEYPEYGDLLRGKLKRDKKRNEDISRAREAFNFLVLVRSTIKRDTCKRLPQELVAKIISQLSKFDQRHLTLCGDDLKKQLLRNKRKR